MSLHRKILFRLAGAALLLVACGAGHALLAIGAGHAGREPPLAYLLAAIGFACASAGTALLVHGHHLLDTVPVSRLWQTPAEPAAPERRPSPE